MKTTIRVTVIIPDCYANIQRLYDMGTYFKLEEEIKTGHNAADFIEQLQAAGGKLIEKHEFIDDDDFKNKLCATYEYIPE